MSNEKSLNIKIEQFICEKFLELFNEENGCSVQMSRSGDPNKNEPDFMCSDGIAVEVTRVHSSKEDARISGKMNHGKPDHNLQYDEHGGQMMNGFIKTTDEQSYAVSEIMKKHDKLNKGNYSGCPNETKIYLVCNALAQNSSIGMSMEEKTIDGIREKLHKDLSQRTNEKHFDGIFLLLNNTGKYYLKKVWQPKKG